MRKNLYFLLISLLAFACNEAPQTTDKAIEKPEKEKPAAISLLGKPLFATAPSEKLLEKYRRHKANYEANPTADNLIWYARFVAYQGKYEEAIQLYTKGIAQYPEDARFLRHRGHRYISIRKFDEAIVDYNKAVQLIQGKDNEIEPDGMPNAKNTPVSTLHGNIYYHLGLAHYLKHDFPNALAAYKKGLEIAGNPDNVVSTVYWIYMILRRMDQEAEAQKVLSHIEKEMPVIENMTYHEACLFFKGLLSKEAFAGKEDEASPSDDAVNYCMGNWYFYNGEKEKAKTIFENILTRKSWSSFGYLAAEKDYATHFSN